MVLDNTSFSAEIPLSRNHNTEQKLDNDSQGQKLYIHINTSLDM